MSLDRMRLRRNPAQMRLLLGAGSSLLLALECQACSSWQSPSPFFTFLPAWLSQGSKSFLFLFRNSFDDGQICFLANFSLKAGGSVHKPPVGSLGNLPGQLAQLFLWSMDNFDKKMAEQDRYGQLVGQKILSPNLFFCKF